jgi:cold shock CspA family protein
MKPAFWTCGRCESLNPPSADTCETCSLRRAPDELADAGHLRHLIASLGNSERWRIATVGPGYVEIAARSRAVAEARGAELLAQDAYPDQSVTVVSARSRGWLVYVRSALIPYPTSTHPRQQDPAAARSAAGPPVPPVEGRMYLGRVLVWFGDKGYGSIACSNRGIGNVAVRRADLTTGQETFLRAGQHVCFCVKRTADGLYAVDIMAM